MNILRLMIPKSSVEYISGTSTVRQALEKMRYHHYVAIPVLDEEGMYIGTLRNDDIFKYFMDNGRFDSRSAERDSVLSILDKDYSKPLYHNASINELIENVKEHNFVPVVDDRGCFIGMVLRRDVLSFLLKFYESGNSEVK
ncbi:MAG: CBS domain-containing protein [Ruminococcaceae bacterium]|nr:CBS domain-containing protein [Oscillospiraceae bacterium]